MWQRLESEQVSGVGVVFSRCQGCLLCYVMKMSPTSNILLMCLPCLPDLIFHNIWKVLSTLLSNYRIGENKPAPPAVAGLQKHHFPTQKLIADMCVYGSSWYEWTDEHILVKMQNIPTRYVCIIGQTPRPSAIIWIRIAGRIRNADGFLFCSLVAQQ